MASSALRNLKKFEIRGRSLKADFASDNKNGNNLKREDVLYRDRSEIVRPSNAFQQNPSNCALQAEMLTPHDSNLEEMLSSLSEEQEELLLVMMRDISKHLHETGQRAEQRALVETLARDEVLLKTLTKMLNRVQNKSRPSAYY